MITEPRRGPQIRYHALSLLNAETQKSCPTFCLFKWRSSINKQPLFVLPLSLLYLLLLFCGLLWYWQHCMLVVTVCLQGSIKTKWVCTNEVPALAALTSPNGRNQSQKNHFFSSAPPRPGSRYRNIRIDASLYHASRPRISCITQNTSNSHDCLNISTLPSWWLPF